jgi:hypothetical protein
MPPLGRSVACLQAPRIGPGPLLSPGRHKAGFVRLPARRTSCRLRPASGSSGRGRPRFAFGPPGPFRMPVRLGFAWSCARRRGRGLFEPGLRRPPLYRIRQGLFVASSIAFRRGASWPASRAGAHRPLSSNVSTAAAQRCRQASRCRTSGRTLCPERNSKAKIRPVHRELWLTFACFQLTIATILTKSAGGTP